MKLQSAFGVSLTLAAVFQAVDGWCEAGLPDLTLWTIAAILALALNIAILPGTD